MEKKTGLIFAALTQKGTGEFMLTPQEEKFMQYWSRQREEKGRFLKKTSGGTPLALLMAGGLLLSVGVLFLFGWHKEAERAVRTHGSVIIVILLAAVGIFFFIRYFSARYYFEQNEQLYQELLVKRERAGAAG